MVERETLLQDSSQFLLRSAFTSLLLAGLLAQARHEEVSCTAIQQNTVVDEELIIPCRHISYSSANAENDYTFLTVQVTGSNPVGSIEGP